MTELNEQLRAALKSAQTGQGSYGPNYDGAKLADAINAILRRPPSPAEGGQKLSAPVHAKEKKQSEQSTAPQAHAESVGEACTMPGTSGFTMACFKAANVPLGTKLYATPAPAAPSAERDAAGLLNAEELAALRRFNETCEDDEGYDVPKEMMRRLTAIGAVEWKGFSRYQFTEFGMFVLSRDAGSGGGNG